VKRPEQISRHEKMRGYKKHLKQLVTRQRRREEKRDVENAPVRTRFRGYSR
jgi:hypothetical protein